MIIKFDKCILISLYKSMYQIRQAELALQRHYREGDIPGFIHLSIGEEAVAVGVCAGLTPSDVLTSTHRGHGHAIAKGVPLAMIFAEIFGKASGCCGGRGGSMHLYSLENGFYGTNGIVGAGIPISVGLGISQMVKKTNNVAVCFFGDGAVNHGSFHESINLAAVLNAPVIFVCENNLYATCVAYSQVSRNDNIASKAAAYGIPGVRVDGNNVLEVFETAQNAIARARSGQGPTLIEAMTYRTVGHHEGDILTGTYRTAEELESWKKRCPIAHLENYILENDIVSKDEIHDLCNSVDDAIRDAISFALKSELPAPETVSFNCWAKPINPPNIGSLPSRGETKIQNWLDAVRDGIQEEMQRNHSLLVFGEGIGQRGGSWGHTKGLWEKFGSERVIDMPISELGFTGAAIGASMSGSRTIVDMMFADFIFEAASQIIHQASKIRYITCGKASVGMLIRAACSTIKQAGPHHSGTFHSIWAHIPGLVVVMPSNAVDAKGLIKTALNSDNPVIFLEPKPLFSVKAPIPLEPYYLPLCQANIIQKGSDLTIVAAGLSVIRSIEAAKILCEQNINPEIIDLRTVFPIDMETIIESVARTGRLLVVDEDFAFCGLAGEILASVSEQAFSLMKSPPGRITCEPVPSPFSPPLETAATITVAKIVDGAKAVMAGKPLVPTRISEKLHPSSCEMNILSSTVSSKTSVSIGKVADGRRVEIFLPNQDLTVSEGTVIKWLKPLGAAVAQNEPLVEIETDKAVMEVEAVASGILENIFVQPGNTVPLGTVLGHIREI